MKNSRSTLALKVFDTIVIVVVDIVDIVVIDIVCEKNQSSCLVTGYHDMNVLVITLLSYNVIIISIAKQTFPSNKFHPHNQLTFWISPVVLPLSKFLEHSCQEIFCSHLDTTEMIDLGITVKGNKKPHLR